MPDPQTTPGSTPNAPRVTMARLGIVTGDNDEASQWVDVQFNPASLQLQVRNELKNETRNDDRTQYINKTSAKLTMDLQFDNTPTGVDVTETTRQIEAFISPPLPAGQTARPHNPPPIILFEWGKLKFRGIAENYKETLDFFSAGGVPLRASVNLTLSRQNTVFDPAQAQGAGGGSAANVRNTPATSAAQAANATGSPEATRAVGESNQQESVRFGNGSPLSISDEVPLKPPAPFADAGGGLGTGVGIDAAIGGGASIGIGGGVGIGVGGSVGIGVSGGAGIGVSGGAGISGLARLSATEGAFAGLRPAPSAGASTIRLDTSQLLPRARSTTLSIGPNATFQVGGRATAPDSSGLAADVGVSGGFGGKLSFDEF